MREILFRGKTLNDNEWVEGFYVNQFGAHEIYCLDDSDYKTRHVDPLTVGQYTGLTDKNSKRIFEGDIVRLLDITVGEIVLECGALGIGFRKQIDYDYLASEIASITGHNNTPAFCYNDNYVSLWELYWNYNEEDDNISVIEVIGNIHDNPELLEVKE